MHRDVQASPFAKTLYCLSWIVVYAVHDTICAQLVGLKASNSTRQPSSKAATTLGPGKKALLYNGFMLPLNTWTSDGLSDIWFFSR
jgi:hypothetical protein